MTERMSIVEKMARAKCAHMGQDPDFGGDFWDVYAEDAESWLRHILTATGLTEQQLEGLANGTMVVMPVEPTEAMLAAFQHGMSREFGITTTAGYHGRIYRAMIAAKEG